MICLAVLNSTSVILPIFHLFCEFTKLENTVDRLDV